MLFAIFNPATDTPSNFYEGMTKLVWMLYTSPTTWVVCFFGLVALGALGWVRKHTRREPHNHERIEHES